MNIIFREIEKINITHRVQQGKDVIIEFMAVSFLSKRILDKI